MEIAKIRQALFILENDIHYKFDILNTITIHNLKRMIVAAANLNKSRLRIFHNGLEYTFHDDSTFIDLFPDENLVEFTVQLSPLALYDENESKIKLKIGDSCPLHEHKYLYYYCYDCKKSLCSICILNVEHAQHQHKTIEKYDYLQSSKHLVDDLFGNINGLNNLIFNSNLKNLTQGYIIEEIRTRITTNYFPALYNLLKKLENKLVDALDTIDKGVQSSWKNSNDNIGLIKEHCISGLDKLKKEINIENMMVDHQTFLTFDKKYRDMEKEKFRTEIDARNLDELAKFMEAIKELIQSTYDDISTNLDRHIHNPLLEDFNYKVSSHLVKKVSADEIHGKILSDISNKSKSGIKNQIKNLLDDKSKLKNIFNDNSGNSIPRNTQNNSKENISPGYKNSEPLISPVPFEVSNPFLTNNLNTSRSSIDDKFKQAKDSAKYLAEGSIGKQNSNDKRNEDKRYTNSFPSYNDLSLANDNQSFQSKTNHNLNENKSLPKGSSIKKDKTSVDKTYQQIPLEDNNQPVKVMRCLADSNIIQFYDDPAEVIQNIEIKFTPLHGIKSFLHYCTWVNHDEKLYISGGEISPGNGSNSSFCFDLRTKELIRLPDMNVPRFSHSMIYVNGALYVVGGAKNNTTEKYDIATKRWIKASNLISDERQNSALHSTGNYIYAFFGYKVGFYLDTIERLNIKSTKGKWESVAFKNPEKLQLRGIFFGIITVSEKEIFIFGGKYGNEVKEQMVRFDFTDNTFTLVNQGTHGKGYYQESQTYVVSATNESSIVGQFNSDEKNNFLKILLS